MTAVFPNYVKVTAAGFRAIGAAAIAAGSLSIAMELLPPATTLAVVSILWVAMPLGLIADIVYAVRWVDGDDLLTLETPTTHKLAFWVAMTALPVAAASLFEAGLGFLALLAILHFLGLAVSRGILHVSWERYEAPQLHGAPDVSENRLLRDVLDRRMVKGFAAFLLVMAAGPVWLALGNSVDWAENVVLAVWWPLAICMLLLSALALYNFIEYPMPCTMLWRLWKKGGTPPARPPRAGQLRWTAFVAFGVTLAAFLMAGQVALASTIFLALCIISAGNVQQGINNARPSELRNLLLRMNHSLFSRMVLMLVSPVRQVSILLNRGCAREAAELREAFGRPAGLIYFVYSMHAQRQRCFDDDALLAPYRQHVVAREWGRLSYAAKEQGWLDFAKTPEGRILARHGVQSEVRDLPFMLIVPPRGCASACKLASNDPQLRASEFMAAAKVAKAFGPPDGQGADSDLSPSGYP